MTAASTSDARKRNTPAPDPVEVVARALTAEEARGQDPAGIVVTENWTSRAQAVIAALRAEGMIND